MKRLFLSLFCVIALSGCGDPEGESDSTDGGDVATPGETETPTEDPDTAEPTTPEEEEDSEEDATDPDEDTADPNEGTDPDDDTADPADYTIDSTLQAPVSLVAVAANQQVVLRWNTTPNAQAYTVYYSTQEITSDSNLADLLIAVDNLEGTVYTSPEAYLTNGTTYYAAVVAKASLTSTTVSPLSPIKSFVPQDNGVDVAEALGVRELNDSGTLYAVSSDVHLEVCEGGDRAAQGQDCSFGRDVDTIASGDEDGIGGFSFSKVGEDGALLTAESETWQCVQDHVTGLMWEVKDDGDSARGSSLSSGLHDADDAFTWYEPTLSGSGVTEGTQSSTSEPDSCFGFNDVDGQCSTSDFVARVNLEGLCGFNDWRLPSANELMSIVYYGHSFARRSTFALDTNFFPMTDDTLVDSFWTGSPYYDDSNRAWRVYLRDVRSSGQELGAVSGLSKGTSVGVMLVRTSNE